MNQLSTRYNSRRNTPSLYKQEVPEEKKIKNSEFVQKQIQKPSRIRPEAKRCQQRKSKPKLWQISTFCKTLSTAQDVCCRQHGLPADMYQCLHCRQLKRTVNIHISFFHTSLKNSILNLFTPLPPYFEPHEFYPSSFWYCFTINRLHPRLSWHHFLCLASLISPWNYLQKKIKSLLDNIVTIGLRKNFKLGL